MTTSNLCYFPLQHLHELESETTAVVNLSRALGLAIDGQPKSLMSDDEVRGALSWLAFELGKSVDKVSALVDAIQCPAERREREQSERQDEK